MKRVIGAITGTIAGLVLLLSFKTHAPPQVVLVHPKTPSTSPLSTSPLSSSTVPANNSTPPSTVGETPSTTNPSTTTHSSNTTSPRPATTTTTRVVSTTRTLTGDAVNTRYGPVQVQITLSGSTVTDVTAIEYPTRSSRDQEINSFAIPQLTQEALAAQSAQIDSVSGASYTSDGFISSLQSALSKA